MAENKTPAQKVPAPSPAGADPAKAPAVKRLKVPTVRTAAPAPGAPVPAGGGAPAAASAAPVMKAPAKTNAEPDLPPEEKPEMVGQAARKRRRDINVPDPDDAKAKAEEALKKAKKRAKKFLEKKSQQAGFYRNYRSCRRLRDLFLSADIGGTSPARYLRRERNSV